MLKAGTVEELPAGRHQAHQGGARRGRPRRGRPQDAARGGQGRQRADPRHHRRRRRASGRKVEEKAEDQIDKILQPDELPPGVIQLVKVYMRREAEDLGGRQDGRPPRQQGYRGAHRPRGGHAVPPGRHPGRHRAQSARRAEPHERRADPGDAPRAGAPASSGSRRRRRCSAAPTRARSACCSGWRGSAGRAQALRARARSCRRRRAKDIEPAVARPEGDAGHSGSSEAGVAHLVDKGDVGRDQGAGRGDAERS